MDDLISVIVPIYNCEKTIARCVDSIIQQTYKNLELLLIDDGSTDRSAIVCSEYEQKDSRIHVFIQKNGGVSSARNVGLKNIKGKYVTFVDADDMVRKDYIEVLHNGLKKNKVEMAVCNEKVFSLDSELSLEEKNNSYITKIIAVNDFNPAHKRAHALIRCGLYNANLFNQKEFAEDLYVGEDTLMFYQILLQSNKLAIIEEKLYFYRKSCFSLSHEQYNEKRACEIEAWKRITDLCKSKSRKMWHQAKVALGYRCLLGMVELKKERPYYRKNIKKIMIHCCLEYLFSNKKYKKLYLKYCLL